MIVRQLAANQPSHNLAAAAYTLTNTVVLTLSHLAAIRATVQMRAVHRKAVATKTVAVIANVVIAVLRLATVTAAMVVRLL